MVKVMVTRWHATRPYLGVGTYYRKPEDDDDTRHGAWEVVSLGHPLMLDRRQVRMLIEKYGTDSSDEMIALAGAWTLRRELLHMGHDGIVAVEPDVDDAHHGERHMIVVDLTPHTEHDDSVATLRQRMRSSAIDVERVQSNPAPPSQRKSQAKQAAALQMCLDYGETAPR